MGSSKFLECIHNNAHNMVMHTPSASDAKFAPSSPDSRVVLTRRACTKKDERILGKQGEELTQRSKVLMRNFQHVSEIPDRDFAAMVYPHAGVAMVAMDCAATTCPSVVASRRQCRDRCARSSKRSLKVCRLPLRASSDWRRSERPAHSARWLAGSCPARGLIPAASAVEYHSVQIPAVRRSFPKYVPRHSPWVALKAQARRAVRLRSASVLELCGFGFGARPAARLRFMLGNLS